MSAFTKSKSRTLKIRPELDYEQRVRDLENLGKTTEIDDTESIVDFYRGSIGMIRTADVQYSNSELENAFMSYLKFLDLFRSKIKQHADYKRVPLSVKSTNQFYQRHAQIRVKELRKKLIEYYKGITSSQQTDDDSIRVKKLCKRDTTVSKLNIFRSKTVSHTDAIDRTALDIEACRCLRTVVVPKQLPTIFQIITQKLKVSCFAAWATLAGELINNEYVITHMIIPKQESFDAVDFSKNPCEPYANKKNLKILGWIHTHRPASCYMAVTDLHAQWEFQSKVPEAIAIVCAPLSTQVETYMLLRNGMKFIGQCDRTEVHSHKSNMPLYTIARHAKVVYHMQFELVYLEDNGDDELGVNCSSHAWVNK